MRYPYNPGYVDPVNGDTGSIFPPATGGRVAPSVMPRQPMLAPDPTAAAGPGAAAGAPAAPMDDMNPDVRNGIAQLLQRQIMTSRGAQ